MVKRIILFLLQLAAFIAVIIPGGEWDIIRFGQEFRAMTNHTTFFNPIPVYKYPISSAHVLILNGILFATVLFLLILLFEAIRKAVKPWAFLTFAAYILAIGFSFGYKVGFRTAPTPDTDSSTSSITLPTPSHHA